MKIEGDKGHLRDKQTVLPLEKGELEGDENPLNPKILIKEKLHDKQTSTLLSEASLLYS